MQVNLQPCNGSNNQRFEYVEQALRMQGGVLN